MSTAWPPDIPVFYPGIMSSVDALNLMGQTLNSLLNPPIFRAERSTALTVAENNHQFIAWNTPLEDSAGVWSAGSPSIYPAPASGWYQVEAAVSLSTSAAGAAGLVLIPAVSVNNSSPTGQPAGTSGWEGPEVFVPSTAGGQKVVCHTWDVYANKDDPIQIDLWYSTESTITAVDTTAKCRVGIVGLGV